MTNRNFQMPTIDPNWAASRETHPAVATAIHAIAGSGPWADRTPEAIWEAPTQAEWDHVAMAVEEYVRAGDFEASEDGAYSWGMETLRIGADSNRTMGWDVVEV